MSATRMMPVFLAATVCFLTTGATALAQLGAPISPPTRLNEGDRNQADHDQLPWTASDGSGNLVAVWHARPAVGVQDIRLSTSSDHGATWTATVDLTAGADGDGSSPRVATDGLGVWIVTWDSKSSLGETIGPDQDILFSRSVDNGASWTDPAILNTNAASDTGDDRNPYILVTNDGTWMVVWQSGEDLGGTLGTDQDILVARSADDGTTWTSPEALNSNAATDSGADRGPVVAADGNGNYVAAWYSTENINGIGTDWDILTAASADGGLSWGLPGEIGPTASIDGSSDDLVARVATDGIGNWVLVWYSTGDLGLGLDSTGDIVAVRSTDAGSTWSTPIAIDSNATVESRNDLDPWLLTDGAGNWIVAWESAASDFDLYVSRSQDAGSTWSDVEFLNTDAATDNRADRNVHVSFDHTGTFVAVWNSGNSPDNTDVYFARFNLSCDTAVSDGAYGLLLFQPRCTRSSSLLSQSVYSSTTIGLANTDSDSYYLSGSDTGFTGLVVDDAVHVNGWPSGLGPYAFQPGVPPFLLGCPIDFNLVPLPAIDVTALIPAGREPVQFTLLDTQQEIHGNTAVYLVRDCGVYLGQQPELTIHWVSHDVTVVGLQSDLDLVTGNLSELRSDGNFVQACSLGEFLNATQIDDTRPDPVAGDGYYYLVRGTCAANIGYGDSSLSPDPRDDLETSPPSACP